MGMTDIKLNLSNTNYCSTSSTKTIEVVSILA